MANQGVEIRLEKKKPPRAQLWCPGADQVFSRDADLKKFEKLVELFLGRLNWYSELSQITRKSPFWPNFLRRMQDFEKKTHSKAEQWLIV